MRKGRIITLRVRMPKKVVFRRGVKRVGDHFPDRYEIDINIPPRYRKSLILHEIVEDKLQGSGMSYRNAHRFANRIEEALFPYGKRDSKRYEDKVVETYNLNRKMKKVM